MRILWVKMGGLWPPTAGGRIRSLEILSWLSQHHEVTVLTTCAPGDDLDGLARRLPHCRRILAVPHVAPRIGSAGFAVGLARSWSSPLPVDLWKWRVAAVQAKVRDLVASDAVEIAVADFLVAMPNVPTETRIPLVLFEHNVEHTIWQRLAACERRPWRRALLELEWRKMRRVERAACARADLTIAVSDDDRRRLLDLAPSARCVTIPTGVAAAYFTPSGRPEMPHHLVFTGSMDWHPNEDAILHFSGAILPLIRAAFPRVTVTVVGRNPSPRLRAAAADAGIVVTGTVEDVRPYVEDAAVYVVPLRVGGGTRLKIFEALAMGKAVVSTTVGAEGLALTPDRDICIADGPERFARAVIALLHDPARRRVMGESGRRLVSGRYSWEQVAGKFDHHCRALLSATGTVGESTIAPPA